MKHLSASFAKLLAVAAGALTLGSCNRAEYAVLPRTSSAYHGVARVAAPVSVAPAAAMPATAAAPAAEPAVAKAAPAPVSAPAPAVAPSAEAVAAPAAPVATPADAPATAAAPARARANAAAPTPPRKLNLAQRLAVAKITKQLQKVARGPQFKQQEPAADTQRVSGNLRIGLVLLLVGLLVSLFNGLIGTIVALVGVIFIVLWLLDSL